MDNAEERALIEKAKHDPEAFGELYERYVTRIYNYLYRHTSSVVEAEDLTSRTFFRALRGIGRYRDKGASFQAWLFRIAHNLVVNWYRDNARQRDIPMENIEQVGHTVGRTPHDELEAEEERLFLLQAIRHLPEDRKTLIILKFVEQMTNAEIGAVLGRSEGAIKSLYHRTLLSLRQVLSASLRSSG